MWVYRQSTGELLMPNGERLAFGFAGNGVGLNCPSAEDQHSVGPLPQGKYKMTSWLATHPTMGLCVIELTPDPTNDMHQRSGFFCHGAVNINFAGLAAFLKSSDGCIVIGDCGTRRTIWMNTDHELEVVP